VDEKLNMSQLRVLAAPQSQPYPGLHQEKRGQQGEGQDSAPLLCSRETPPGVLRPALESPTEKDMDVLEWGQRRPWR